MESPYTTTRPNPSQLRRRNSIATSVIVPAKLNLPPKPHHAASFPNAAASTSSSSSSSSSADFELISIKPLSYTSLKDLLPCSTAVQSPSSSSPGGDHSGCYEISIRNRLVKQAAWAYLQPMSTSPDSSGGHFLHRFWDRIFHELSNFLRFVNQALTRAFDQFLRALRVRAPDNSDCVGNNDGGLCV